MSNSSISTTQLNQLLQSANPPVIVDVRKKPAFEKDPDTLPGATWQNHEEVALWAKDLPNDRHIVVYCVHGHEVSQNACKNLRALGFEAAFLKGGIDAWKQAGLPLASLPHTKSSE